jgi:arsenate reductase-like glutaredoxin family protein
MNTKEKEVLEIAVKKSGIEFYRFLDIVLKKINNEQLKAIISTKKEEIKKAKREQDQAIRNLELKRTFKEYLRKDDVKKYIRLCRNGIYFEV